jgi:hypothetical protein
MRIHFNPLTGEVIREDDFEDYQPHGDCATGCGHPATEVWQLYKGQQRFDFRCHCCVIASKLDRARWYAARIPALEAEYKSIKENCNDRDATTG